MKIKYYEIPGSPVYYHLNTGLVDNNKERLLRQALWRKRLSGTLAIPFAAFVAYGVAVSTSYYAPTDILGKIRKACRRM